MTAQDANGAWLAVFGDSHGTILQAVCTAMRQVPPNAIREAIQNIQRAEATGPMLDPSNCRGQWFDRASEWKEVAKGLLALRLLLPEDIT
jgi:hypothetical protein